MMMLWIVVALVAGGLIGYLLGRSAGGGDQARVEELEQALEKNRRELEDYRRQVKDHFRQTAGLFEEMTDRYREVYRHLAAGAMELCDEQPPALRLEPATGEKPGLAADTGPGSEDSPVAPETASGTGETTTESGDDLLGDAPQVPELAKEDTPDRKTG